MNSLDSLKDPVLERRLIGHLLSRGKKIRDLYNRALKTNDWTVPDCRAAFVELEALLESDCPDEDLPSRLEKIAQRHALTEMEPDEDAFNQTPWIWRLSDLSCRRSLFNMTQKAGEKALNPNCDLRVLLDNLISESKCISGRWLDPRREPIYEGIIRILEEFERDYSTRGKPLGLPSGFQGLDALTSGFLPGNLYLIAGRSGAGKTAFALSIAMRALRERKVKVSFSVVKENSQDILRPLLLQHSRIASKQFQTGQLTSTDFDRLSSAARELTNGNLDLRFYQKRAMTDVKNQATQLAQISGQRLMVIDDADRLSYDGFPFSQVCENLHALARKQNIPIVAFCKLESDRGDEYEPWKQMKGVYEDQLLEFRADTGMLLRKGIADSAELRVIRNVGRSIGVIPLKFDGEALRFSELN